MSWQEVADCRDPDGLRFTADQVVRRVEEQDDLMAPLLDPGTWRDLPV